MPTPAARIAMISLSLPMRANPITMPASTATGKGEYQYAGEEGGSNFTGERERQIGVEGQLGEAAGLLGEENRRQQHQREQRVR